MSNKYDLNVYTDTLPEDAKKNCCENKISKSCTQKPSVTGNEMEAAAAGDQLGSLMEVDFNEWAGAWKLEKALSKLLTMS